MREALQRLYPDQDVPTLDFGPGFTADRDRVLARGDLDTFKALRGLEREMRDRAYPI